LISLSQIVEESVPSLIEFLILLDVGLFAVLALALMSESKLFHLALEILLLELCDSVLGHLCLDIAAFLLALGAELLAGLNESLNVFSCDFLVLTEFRRSFNRLFLLHII